MSEGLNLQQKIGARVGKIRTEIGISKEEFASRIGMQKAYLCNVESGKNGLTAEKTVKICQETNTSADYVLRGVENSLLSYATKRLKGFSDEEISKSFKVFEAIVDIIRHK